MIKIVYTYDVVPGKASDAKEWARKKWIPFWMKQPKVSDYRVFSNIFGAEGGIPVAGPQRMVTFYIKTLGDLEEIFTCPEFRILSKELQGFVMNLKFMQFKQSYPDTVTAVRDESNK